MDTQFARKTWKVELARFRPFFAGVFRLDVVDPPIHAASLNEQLTLVQVLQPARDFVPLHESLVEGCSNGPKRLTPRKRVGSLQARIRDGRFTQPRSRSGTSRQQDHAWWNVRSEGYENLFQQREIENVNLGTDWSNL